VEDDIIMELRKSRCGGMYWIHLAQDREQWMALVSTVMNFLVPYNFGKFLSSYTTGSF
jgi:hypothetical protein